MTTPTATAIYAHIKLNPGATIRCIADALETRYQDIYSALTKLETPETLVYEADNGRLYPFEEKELVP